MLAAGLGSLHSEWGEVSSIKTMSMFAFSVNNDITKDRKHKL